jgi:hypothetical protein
MNISLGTSGIEQALGEINRVGKVNYSPVQERLEL